MNGIYHRVAFTGTRAGMTEEQQQRFSQLLFMVQAQTLIHGDCLGADAHAHAIARSRRLRVEILPCNLVHQRAYCDGDYVGAPEAPLVRNKRIVKSGDLLVGTPKGTRDEKRSGTWSTIRYAEGMRPICIIWPNGMTTEH